MLVERDSEGCMVPNAETIETIVKQLGDYIPDITIHHSLFDATNWDTMDYLADYERTTIVVENSTGFMFDMVNFRIQALVTFESDPICLNGITIGEIYDIYGIDYSPYIQ